MAGILGRFFLAGVPLRKSKELIQGPSRDAKLSLQSLQSGGCCCTIDDSFDCQIQRTSIGIICRQCVVGPLFSDQTERDLLGRFPQFGPRLRRIVNGKRILDAIKELDSLTMLLDIFFGNSGHRISSNLAWRRALAAVGENHA